MKKTYTLSILFALVAALSVSHAQTTAINYQGSLKDADGLASGQFEFEFELFDSATTGTSVSSTLTQSSISVTDGLFSTDLDFTELPFDGSNLWLEIRVRPQGATDSFATLAPRQTIHSAPYAIRAITAGSAAQADLADTASSAVSVAIGGVDTAALQSGSVGSEAVTDESLLPIDLSLNAFDLTFWKLDGNTGTIPGTHSLGTSDSQPLELMVNGQRALLIENTVGTPNLIGGYSGNDGGTDSVGGAIGGGGAVEKENTIGADSDYGVIAGGVNNVLSASRRASVVGGGENNTATGSHGIIAGGVNNYNAGWGASIGGGNANKIWANDATIGGGVGNEIHANSRYSTVGGGVFNKVLGQSVIAVIGGGQENTIGTESSRSTISGGFQNAISDKSWGSTIAGGWSHGINSNSIYSTIGGGEDNTIETDAPRATIGGGIGNTIHSNAPSAFIGGGNQNVIGVGAQHAGISGGWRNEIGTDSRNASIQGGYQNRIGENSDKSSIGGGAWNRIDDWSLDSTISGGYTNRMSGIVLGGVVAGGSYNQLNDSLYGSLGGGYSNIVSSSYGTVPGGYQNHAVAYSFAAGRQAKAYNVGSFVWGDSQNTDVVSTATDQVTFRARNGFRLTENAGGSKAINVGDRYRDNTLLAWGKVSSNGILNADFGVSSVTRASAGVYDIVLTGSAAGIHTLIPVAMPEIDNPPINASTVRIVSINQDSSVSNPNSFQVYINNGNYTPVDNDFVFMVTAR